MMFHDATWKVCWIGSMNGNEQHWWISTELQMHLRAGDCAEEIHKKTRRRRCRLSGVSQLNMNYFEYLPGIQQVWGMKFTFAAVQTATNMVFADG